MEQSLSSSSGSILGFYTIDANSFFAISDEDVLCLIRDTFPEELNRLKRAYSTGTKSTPYPSSPSPSQILYGTEYDEVNRTLVGILALRWIHDGKYETFVGTQPEPVRLMRESFDWMRSLFANGIKKATDLYALVTSMVVNDLGKDPQLAADYHDRTGADISDLNHDMILVRAVKAGLVECLDRLPPEHRADIIRGMELGAEFNFGQLAQAENAPACLSSLIDMRGEKRSFELRFMEQLLDIAGAAGHMDWTCAKKLIEPIFEAYCNVYDVATAIISDGLRVRDGYELILTRRSAMLHRKGFRALDIRDPKDRALMRLLCMGGVADLETARLYDSAWNFLDELTKSSLVHSLNVDGSIIEPAVQPTYMPALLAQCVNATESRTWDEKLKMLQSILHYLARVMTVTEKPKGPVSVIERSVLIVLKNVVDFQADPGILDRTDVPKCTIAKMG